MKRGAIKYLILFNIPITEPPIVTRAKLVRVCMVPPPTSKKIPVKDTFTIICADTNSRLLWCELLKKVIPVGYEQERRFYFHLLIPRKHKRVNAYFSIRRLSISIEGTPRRKSRNALLNPMPL